MTIKSTHPLRLWRISKQMPLAELAALVRLSKPYLSQIENGKKQPSPDAAKRLSKRTKIPVEQFAL